MPSYIKDDFKPDANTLNLLRKKGIFEDFCDHIMPHFMSYWLDLKNQGKAQGKKSSWQSTFLNWAIRSHQGTVGREYEENKHKRYGRGGLRNDLFEQIADKVLNGGGAVVQYQEDKPPKVIDYRETLLKPKPIPGEGKTMTFEQAQAELKKMGIVK